MNGGEGNKEYCSNNLKVIKKEFSRPAGLMPCGTFFIYRF